MLGDLTVRNLSTGTVFKESSRTGSTFLDMACKRDIRAYLYLLPPGNSVGVEVLNPLLHYCFSLAHYTECIVQWVMFVSSDQKA